jgi:hypothetical protein
VRELQIREYRPLIVPSGNFIDGGNSLTSSTTANIRNAIQIGLNCLGICADHFFAGDAGFKDLNRNSGVMFSFYAAERRGIRKAEVTIAGAGAPTLDQYWEDGPWGGENHHIDVLPLARGALRAEVGPDQAAEGTGERECVANAMGDRAVAGEAGYSGCS